MSYQPVDIRVFDTTPTGAPIAGVIVKVLSRDGTRAITQGITDETGNASFLLPMDVYQVRFFKFSVNFKSVLVNVPDAPSMSWAFGELFQPPTVPDARLCMAYGYFRDVTGAPAANVEIIFIAKFKPLWLEGSSILTERRAFRTDEKGYLEVPLIRCGQYDVTVTGYENYTRTVFVPDALNINVNDLLFPIVQQITFVPPGPYIIRVGSDNDTTITPTVYASDGRILCGTATDDVQWSSSDQTVLVVLPTQKTLTLRGLSPGTAELRATRWDTTIIHIPDPGITGVPVPVIVVP